MSSPSWWPRQVHVLRDWLLTIGYSEEDLKDWTPDHIIELSKLSVEFLRARKLLGFLNTEEEDAGPDEPPE